MTSGYKILNDEHGNIISSIEYFNKLGIPKDSRILDLGCGYGSFLYNLMLNGYQNTTGLDVDKSRIEKGHNNYPILKGKLSVYLGEVLPFDDSSFDVICMFDVIEHIPDVKRFLKKEVFRVLKRNGLFVFQTPNKIINVPWEIIHKRSFTRWKEYHCSLQTFGSLKRLLKRTGFESIVIEKFNILTDHNIRKTKKVAGIVGFLLLHILQRSPLVTFPNFWGYCQKP